MKELLSIIQKAGTVMNIDDSTTYWFRGHSNCSFQLIPSIFRPLKDENGNVTGHYDEAKLLKEFIRIHPEARDKHRDNLELLTYAQHYGLPTRLLDWTTNLLVAIFFACKDNVDKDAHLVIYKPNIYLDLGFDPEHVDFKIKLYGELPALNVDKNAELFFIKDKFISFLKECRMSGTINGQSANECSIHTNDKEPELELVMTSHNKENFKNVFSDSVPYTPIILNERLRRQHGCFTLHGGKRANGRLILPIISMEEEVYFHTNERTDKILINKEEKPLILQQLLKLGINEASIFPELEYQTKSILSDCITKTANGI
ncbi:FRG domain-containing protein [Shewanella baltica]|uniref:FRG domain-containing protein n=1 Tax=Shewanella baltica TaxID=62322 RepID=UPI003D79F0C3